MSFSNSEIIEKLKKIPLFKNMTGRPEILQILAAVLLPRKIQKGERIITEGAFGNEMYILFSGEINISKFTMEKEQFTVAILNDSMNVFFGELALVDEDKRSASVTAVTDCDLLVFTRERFFELGKTHNDIGWLLTVEIASILAQRLRKANEEAVVLFETLVNELAS